METRQRLELLDAQLDEAVAGVVELSLRQGDPAEAGALGNRVGGLVGEMESLRLALESRARQPADATGGTPRHQQVPD